MTKYISKKNKRKLKRKKRIIVVTSILTPILILIGINYKYNLLEKFKLEEKLSSIVKKDGENIEESKPTIEVKEIVIKIFEPENNEGWKQKKITNKEDIKIIQDTIEGLELSEKCSSTLTDMGIVIEYNNGEKQKIMIFNEKIMKENQYYKSSPVVYLELKNLYTNMGYEEIIY